MLALLVLCGSSVIPGQYKRLSVVFWITRHSIRRQFSNLYYNAETPHAAEGLKCFVLYLVERLSLIINEKHTLRVFEIRVLMRIF
jgi:hypothetical protein